MPLDATQGAIPGTIQLVDVDHTLEARHAGNGDIVLQPTPSNHPDDPLNWTPRRKLLALICPNLYVMQDVCLGGADNGCTDTFGCAVSRSRASTL
jgi:hypothetical protein